MPYVEFTVGGGLNRKAPGSDIGDNELSTADGCRFDTSGVVSSERGRTTLYTVTGGTISGHLDTYRGGTKRRLTKAGSTLYEDEVSIGTMTGSDYASMVFWGDRVYIGDGTNVNTWDGTTLLTTIGVTAPTDKLSTAVSGTGNTIATGDYRYAYTFFNGVAESNFSPMSDAQTVTLGEQVDLTSIAVSTEAGVTSRRIYRTDLNGSVLFFLTEIKDNTTTTYTDTAKLPAEADADTTPGDTLKTEPRPTPEVTEKQAAKYSAGSLLRPRYPDIDKSSQGPDQTAEGPQIVMSNLGALADWTDHDPAPSDLEGLIFHQGQLFGFSGNEVRFSRVNEPEHWPLFNAFTPGRRNAENIMALVPLGGNIVVYTDSNIYMFSPVGLSFETGELRDMLSPVGLASKQGVVPIVVGAGQEAGHLFIAKSGVYLFDGTRVREISFKVEHIFTDPNSTDFATASLLSQARAVAWRDKIWLSYAAGSGANDRTLFIDFQDTQDPKFSILKYGYSLLALEKKDSIPVGGTTGGSLVQVDTGDANQDGDLLWSLKTKEQPLTTNNTLVGLESLVLDADFGNASTVVRVSTDTGKLASFTYVSTESGRERLVRDLPHSLKGRRVSVILQSFGQTPRHLYGYGFNYSPEGAP